MNLPQNLHAILFVEIFSRQMILQSPQSWKLPLRSQGLRFLSHLAHILKPLLCARHVKTRSRSRTSASEIIWGEKKKIVQLKLFGTASLHTLSVRFIPHSMRVCLMIKLTAISVDNDDIHFLIAGWFFSTK